MGTAAIIGNVLKAMGVPITAIKESDYESDGELTVTDKVTVQVGNDPMSGKTYIIVNRWAPSEEAFYHSAQFNNRQLSAVKSAVDEALALAVA